MKVLKVIVFLMLLVLGIVVTFYGIAFEDVLEVMSNGSILCLSCVGIG